MRVKIELVTLKDCQKLSAICEKIGGKIELFNPKNRYRVNAKSLIGCLSAIEWNDLWIESEKDITEQILEWIIDDDNASIHE